MSAVVTKPSSIRRGDERRIRSVCSTVESDGRCILRTPAVEEREADWFVHRGFHRVQSLVMLHRDCLPDTTPDRGVEFHSWRRLQTRRRDALRADLLALDALAFPPPWNLSHDAFARACRSTGDHTVLVRRGATGAALGFAVVGRGATSAYLQRLAVHPVARRRGVASLLVREASAWAESRGADTLYVNTEPTNHPALELYRRLGFSVLTEQLWVLERHATVTG